MEIEFALPQPRLGAWIGVAILLAGLGLGLLGRVATPVQEDGAVVLLTPERWQTLALSRAAQAETEALQRDTEAIQGLLDQAPEGYPPDPVAAMLLAEGIYARQRDGTSATAAARQATIDAAETIARYAAGSIAQAEAIDALNRALLRLAILTHSAGHDDSDLPADPGTASG